MDDMDNIIRRSFLERGTADQHFDPGMAGMPPPKDFTSSVLVSRLLLLWGWGLLSAPTVQWLAEGAVQDGINNAFVQQLATIGHYGLYHGNMRRDLLRMFWPSMKLPKTLRIQIHLKKPRTTLVTEKGHTMINPLEFVDALFDQYPEVFSAMLGRNTKYFWDQVDPNDPKFDKLADMRARPNWQDKAVPIVLHGDSVQFTTKNKNSLYSIQWKSLLAYGFDLATMLLSCIPKCIRASYFKRDRFDSGFEIWEYIALFFNAMYEGSRPPRDPRGRPWPEGSLEEKNLNKPFLGGQLFIVCWKITGDLEHNANDLWLPHFNSQFPCGNCCVNRIEGTPLPVTDLSRDAAWKAPENQLCNTDLPSRHPIWTIHGVTRSHCTGDLMHTGDGGVLLYFIGGVMQELVVDATLYQGNMEAKTSQLFTKIQQKYDELSSENRLTSLYPSMFTDDHTGFPCLSAKCAEARHLVPVMVLVLEDRGINSRLDAHRLEACKQLDRLYTIVSEGDMFLTATEAAGILDSVERFLLHFNFLHDYWEKRGKLLYNITIKAHCLWHIAADAKYLNPRCHWAYDFEDFVGKILKSAKACVAGTPMDLIAYKVCTNFLIVSELQCRMHVAKSKALL